MTFVQKSYDAKSTGTRSVYHSEKLDSVIVFGGWGWEGVGGGVEKGILTRWHKILTCEAVSVLDIKVHAHA